MQQLSDAKPLEKKPFILYAPSITIESGKAHFEANVTRGDKVATINIDIPEEFSEFLAPTCDPLLAACLLPAMSTGSNIEIFGPISPVLLSTAQRSLQAVLACNKPHLKKVNIKHFGELAYNSGVQDCIATGFSSGIDSLCAVHDFFSKALWEGEKLTHLISNNFSRYRNIGEWERNFTRSASKELGLPLIEVNSNIDQLFDPLWAGGEFGAIEVHTLWNATTALALQGRVSRFYYASAYSYPSLKFSPDRDIAFIDPELLRLLSASFMSLESIGSEYTRVEKTKKVRELPMSQRFLNVCTAMPRADIFHNCGKCEKCKRTLLTLEFTGGVEDFSGIFDLSKWRKERKNYTAEIFLRKDPLARELQELVTGAGHSISRMDIMKVATWKFISLSFRFLKKGTKSVLPKSFVTKIQRRNIS